MSKPFSLSASNKESFAYVTVKDRLPVILSRIVDYLYQSKNKFLNTEGSEQCKQYIGYISKLKNEVQTNKPLELLKDSFEDVEPWNDCLNNFQEANQRFPMWFQDPWLLVECYMYRRIQEASLLSGLNHDVFFSEKCSNFHSSKDSVVVLCDYFISQVNLTNVEVDHNVLLRFFTEFFQISLWGNKCDLSLSAFSGSAQSIDPLLQLRDLRSHVLVDDSVCIFHHVYSKKRDKPCSVHIVLDNAGFELMTDLLVALFFIESQHGKCNVTFHMKCMPWFVSDVTLPDFNWLLNELEVGGQTPSASMHLVSKKLHEHLSSGRLVLTSHRFWSLPYAFSDMERVAPDLYSYLAKSDLTIFKGDLNYRKLVGDLRWPSDTLFSTALQQFAPCSLVALRTLKSDVVTGVDVAKARELTLTDNSWMVNGTYGVIQAHLVK